MLREVGNDFRQVNEELERTGPVVVTKNGKGRALLIPIDEDTDIEILVLSNSRRFWRLFDKASSSEQINMEDLLDAEDDAAWAQLSSKKIP